MSTFAPSSPLGSLPLHLRVFNAVAESCRHVGLASELSVPRLVQRAERRRSPAKLGTLDVREPLDVLVDSLRNEAGLAPIGKFIVENLIAQLLDNRLALQQWCSQEPQAAQREIERPIFVIGLPRSGTTLLHNLLAQDPRARALRTWELIAHLHRWRAEGEAQVRQSPWHMRQCIRYLNWAVPRLSQIHPLSADGVDECTMILMSSFVSLAFLLLGPCHSYHNWYMGHASRWMHDVYLTHRQQLNFLARNQPAATWVLKSPTHSAGLEALMTVYPTAQVVLTERSPRESIPSACSLFGMTRLLLCKEVNPRELGGEVGDILGKAVQLAASARARFADRIFVVPYADLVRQPLSTIRQLYAGMDRDFSPAMEAGINRWMASNPQHKHGVHRYSAADFGFDPIAWQAKYGDTYESLYCKSNAATHALTSHYKTVPH